MKAKKPLFPHRKKQTNFRLRPQAAKILEEVQRRTRRNATEVVEYSILKLASGFADLAADVCKAAADIVTRDLSSLPPGTIAELEAWGEQDEAAIQDLEVRGGAAARELEKRESGKPGPKQQDGHSTGKR